METLENPVIKPEELDAQDNNFLEAARLADQGRDIPADLITETKPETTPAEPDVTATEAKVEPEAKVETERARDPITGKFIKTDKEIADEKATDSLSPDKLLMLKEDALGKKEPSDYEKAKKEKARRDDSWQALNKEKEEIRAYGAQLKQREAQMQRPVQQPPKYQLPKNADGEEITSKSLYNAHKDFKARAKKALEVGDYDAFNENTGMADMALENGQKVQQIEYQLGQQAQVNQHWQTWRGHMETAIKSEPDLANPDSDLSKEVQRLLQEQPIFEMLPDGFEKAKEVAKLTLKAASADDFLVANTKLKAEIDRLTGLTSISGGSPTAPPAKKDFTSMSPEEQDAYLMRRAEAVDAGQG